MQTKRFLDATKTGFQYALAGGVAVSFGMFQWFNIMGSYDGAIRRTEDKIKNQKDPIKREHLQRELMTWYDSMPNPWGCISGMYHIFKPYSIRE